MIKMNLDPKFATCCLHMRCSPRIEQSQRIANKKQSKQISMCERRRMVKRMFSSLMPKSCTSMFWQVCLSRVFYIAHFKWSLSSEYCGINMWAHTADWTVPNEATAIVINSVSSAFHVKKGKNAQSLNCNCCINNFINGHWFNSNHFDLFRWWIQLVNNAVSDIFHFIYSVCE